MPEYYGDKHNDPWVSGKGTKNGPEFEAAAGITMVEESNRAPADSESPPMNVVITDIQIPFGRLMAFTVKLAFALTPAFVLLGLFIFLFSR